MTNELKDLNWNTYIVDFTLPIEPFSKQFTSFGQGRMYKSRKTQVKIDEAIFLAKVMAPKAPLSGDLVLSVTFYVKMPKSFSRAKRMRCEEGLIRPSKRPDLSNYVKCIEDILERAGYYFDDKQIVTYKNIRKLYSVDPRIEIKIKEI